MHSGLARQTVVVVQPTTAWVDGEEQRTGWRAMRSTSLDVTDLAQVTPLLASWWRPAPPSVGRPGVSDPTTLCSPRCRPPRPSMHAQRAERYAAGLGVRVGRVDWIAEPGLRQPAGGGVGLIAGRTMAASGDDRPRRAEIAVEPAQLTVTAAVEVGFAIER